MNKFQFRDKLVIWFQENYKFYFEKMQQTDHNYDIDNLNKYHSEGSVWTHTMMVLQYTTCEIMGEEEGKIFQVASLLHDVGKPFALEVKHDIKRNRFKGHEGISTFISLDILEHMVKDDLISYDMRETIVKLISLHGVNNTQLTDVGRRYGEFFRKCDKYGAIRNDSSQTLEYYNVRKFSKSHNPDSKKEVIFVCGVSNLFKTYHVDWFKNSGYTVLSTEDILSKFEFLELESYGSNRSIDDIYNEISNSDRLKKTYNKFLVDYVGIINKIADKIVVDMTLLSLSSRRKMMNLIGEANYKCEVLLPPMEEILKDKPNEIKIRQQMLSFVMPIAAEGFSEINIHF